MSQEDRAEWLDAIYALHQDTTWFRDQRGMVFSFVWFLSVEEGV